MLVTRVGKVALRVPQDRQGRFRTKVFERYQRSEKALVAAMMEIYLHGVSTRKVKMITEELCGHEFSSSTISRIVQQLYERAGQVFCAAAIGRNRIRIVLTASPGMGLLQPAISAANARAFLHRHRQCWRDSARSYSCWLFLVSKSSS
jgi:Transposase, Mutator family